MMTSGNFESVVLENGPLQIDHYVIPAGAGDLVMLPAPSDPVEFVEEDGAKVMVFREAWYARTGYTDKDGRCILAFWGPQSK